MITPFELDFRCSCGETHRWPLSPTGTVDAVCAGARASFRLKVPREKFEALQRAHGTAENPRVYVVHTAGEPRDDQQTCTDCGAVILDYQGVDRAAGGVAWFKPGIPVGTAVDRPQDAYIAAGGLTLHRETRCYALSRPVDRAGRLIRSFFKRKVT